jgi:hypothetical protein
VALEDLLEFAGRFEGMEGRLQAAVLGVVKPVFDEGVELAFLPDAIHQGLLVVELHRGLGHLAVDEQLRLAVGPEALDRVLELELGAGLVAAAVLAGEVLGQPGAEPRPEDGDHDVGFRRPGDLRLEGVGGEQRFVFPEDGLEHRPPGELRLHALDDALRERPFLEHVARRRDEDADCVDFSHALRRPVRDCGLE